MENKHYMSKYQIQLTKEQDALLTLASSEKGITPLEWLQLCVDTDLDLWDHVGMQPSKSNE